MLAAREAMTNAAKFAGVEEIDVYAEVTDDAVERLRARSWRGLRPRAPCRTTARASRESIEGRMERAGGRATIVTSPGNGTEVELHLPRRPS